MLRVVTTRAVLAVLLFVTVSSAVAQVRRDESNAKTDTSNMVLVPGGVFEMGTDPDSLPSTVLWFEGLYPTKLRSIGAEDFQDETPRHAVQVDSLYIDQHEVTNAEYREFVSATGHREPQGMAIVESVGRFRTEAAFCPWSDRDFNGDSQPVVCVSRDDARAYCSWKGKRLPTEAEWEKAARGGLSGKEFSWGDDWPPPAKAGNFAEEAFKQTFTEDRFPAFAGYNDGSVFPAPVGSFRANGYGPFDMIGNVSEWVSDDYGSEYYRQSPARNPTGPDSGEHAITRGGSWFYKWAYVIRVAKREDGPASWRAFDQGFRCATSR